MNGGSSQPPAHTTLIILQKFLRANMNDLAKAKEQLVNALKWRKEYKPHEALHETFSADKFGGLGYVTIVKGATATKNQQDVVAFVCWPRRCAWSAGRRRPHPRSALAVVVDKLDEFSSRNSASCTDVGYNRISMVRLQRTSRKHLETRMHSFGGEWPSWS